MINEEYIHISNPSKIIYNNYLVNSNPTIQSNIVLDNNLNINYKFKSKINKDSDSKHLQLKEKLEKKLL